MIKKPTRGEEADPFLQYLLTRRNASRLTVAEGALGRWFNRPATILVA
jgi:hypothetical protein